MVKDTHRRQRNTARILCAVVIATGAWIGELFRAPTNLVDERIKRKMFSSGWALSPETRGQHGKGSQFLSKGR